MIHLEGGLYPEGSHSDVLFLFLFLQVDDGL